MAIAESLEIRTLLSPTVTSVTASPTTIKDATVGTGTFTVTVVFSEAMDTGTTPTLVFGVDVSGTLSNPSGMWSAGDTTFTVTYDVSDDDVDVDSVTIDVEGAKDANGNDQLDYTPESEFDIDTLNPTVTSVTASPTTIKDATVGTGTFTVTVVFSEAMDTGTTPTLVFGVDVSGTLSNPSGMWSAGDTTFTVTYDVSDDDVDVDSVTIDVEGAKDANGNDQLDYTPESEFDIDTLNPTVTSVTASPITIKDATSGTGTFTVTVVFSEAMDTGTTPTLVFGVDVSGTLSNPSGMWSAGDTTFTVTYDVTDADVDVDSVTIDVTGAKDANGNDQQDYTPESEFDIDTLNPTVTSVTASPTTIKDATSGTGTFTVTVVFSEAMDTGTTPTLVFGVDVSGTLSNPSGMWSAGDTTFTVTYDVTDADVDVDSVTIDVTGAKDANGNDQQDYTPESEFDIDTLNPTVTSVTASPTTIKDATSGTGTFTVTVVFSEAMDTGTTPTLVFGVDVSGTLSNPSGMWSAGDTTFTVTYDVTDADVDVDSVTIDVTGAKDANGNDQQDYTPESEFDIDTLNPTVTSVTASPTTIKDATSGTGTFTVTVVFSEAMDTGTTPTLVFGVDVSGTLSNPSGMWSAGDTTFTVTYDVTDADVDVDSVTIDVTGAKDANGNDQQDYTPESEFDIDTLNPTVTSVTASPTTIKDATSGTGTFTVTVVFSEAMDTGTNPTLTFSPNVSGTLSNASGSWTSSDTFTVTYDVSDDDVDVDSVTIDVTGAKDAVGNAQQDYTPESEFDIDTLNPTVTSVTASPTTIKDATVGTGTFTVTVVFSEAMDTGTNPTLTFSPNVSSTLSNASGSWTSNDTFTVTYDVTDADVDVDSVTIDVTGAKDANGNDQQDYTPESEFDIDTLNPTADIVDVTPDPLTGSNAGVITINFSEPVVGVDISDFTLTRTTVGAGTVSVNISGLSVNGTGASRTIDLSSVTGVEGVYVLTLNAAGSGIKDLAGNDLLVDASDEWVLPTAVVGVDGGGNLTFTDIGDPTDNQIEITVGTGSMGGPFAGQPVLIISDPNGIAAGAGGNQIDNFTIEIPIASLTGTVVIDGGAGNDTLTLDFASGNPIPPGGLVFHGGAGGNDSLVILNPDQLVTVNYDNVTDGSIVFGEGTAARTVRYTGLEPIMIGGTLTDLVFNLPGTNDSNVTLTDQGGGMLRLSGSTFELTDFEIAGVTSITINGNAGNDRISIQNLSSSGYAGSLTIDGGDGNDVLNASEAEYGVTLIGGNGRDTLTGSALDDALDGGAQNDLLNGGGGDDTLTGGAGNDTLNGGDGDDVVVETTISSTMTLTNAQLKGAGTDKLSSIESAVLFGNASHNTLDASKFTLGSVELHGGAGNDTLIGTAFDDLFNGGAGNDVVRKTVTESHTVTVDLGVETLLGGAGGESDSLESIEGLQLIGQGRAALELDASAFPGNTTLEGGSGNDTLTGSSTGNNRLFGNAGHDVLTGGTTADTLSGGAGNDSLIGGSGSDLMKGGDGNDTLLGGDGDDLLFGNAGGDLIFGGTGDDLIDGGAGNDSLTGQDGDDLIIGGAGNDIISGDSGDDTLKSGGGSDKIAGGSGDDRIEASKSRINPGSGNNEIIGKGNTIDMLFSFDFDSLLE